MSQCANSQSCSPSTSSEDNALHVAAEKARREAEAAQKAADEAKECRRLERARRKAEEEERKRREEEERKRKEEEEERRRREAEQAKCIEEELRAAADLSKRRAAAIEEQQRVTVKKRGPKSASVVRDSDDAMEGAGTGGRKHGRGPSDGTTARPALKKVKSTEDPAEETVIAKRGCQRCLAQGQQCRIPATGNSRVCMACRAVKKSCEMTGGGKPQRPGQGTEGVSRAQPKQVVDSSNESVEFVGKGIGGQKGGKVRVLARIADALETIAREMVRKGKGKSGSNEEKVKGKGKAKAMEVLQLRVLPVRKAAPPRAESSQMAAEHEAEEVEDEGDDEEEDAEGEEDAAE